MELKGTWECKKADCRHPNDPEDPEYSWWRCKNCGSLRWVIPWRKIIVGLGVIISVALIVSLFWPEAPDKSYKEHYESFLKGWEGQLCEITKKERDRLDEKARNLNISSEKQKDLEWEINRSTCKGLTQEERSKCPLCMEVAYIFLIDNSESTRDYLDQAKNMAKYVIESAEEREMIAVLTLDSKSGALEGKKEMLLNQINNIHSTNKGSDFRRLFDIVKKMTSPEPLSSEERYRIVFISDGKYEPEDGIYLYNITAEGALAQSLSIYYEYLKDKISLPENCKVDTFAIGENPDEIIMKKIAEDGRGRFYNISDIDDFKRKFQFREEA